MKKILILIGLMVGLNAYSFEHFQIGPSVKLIDVAHPLQAGLEMRTLSGYLGLSVHKGFMPEIPVGDHNVKIDNFDFGLKVHPWKGVFYLGVLVGNQEVNINTSQEYQGQTVTIDGKVKSRYITPHMGWQWRWNSGFFMGMSVGWQMNSGSKTTLSISGANGIGNDPELEDDKEDIKNQANKLGNTPIPNIGLLQLGWMF